MACNYNLFLYRFESGSKVFDVEEALTSIYETYPNLSTDYGADESGEIAEHDSKKLVAVSIRDLSDKADRERLASLISIVSAERRRIRDNASEPLLDVRMVKLAQQDYICIVSQADFENYPVDIDRLLVTLFKTCKYSDMKEVLKESKTTVLKTMAFWNHFKVKENEIWKEYLTNPVDERASELFNVDKSISASIESFIATANITLKALLFCIWGWILCDYFGIEEVLIGDAHDMAELDVIPIRVRRNETIQRTFADVSKQLEEENQHDNCAIQHLEDALGLRLNPQMPVVLNFNDIVPMASALRVLPPQILYRIPATKPIDRPLVISFKSQLDLSYVRYEYNTRLLENFNTKELHDHFESLLRGVAASADTIRERLKLQKNTAEQNEQRILAEKMLFLKKSGIFADYSQSELMELAGKCNMEVKLLEDVIAENEEHAKALYIVCDGMIQVNGIDTERYEKPLYVLKTGECFGSEAVCTDATVHNNYVVSSDYAKLLEIPREIIRTEALEHPGIVQHLLELQSKRLHKFEKLWMLN